MKFMSKNEVEIQVGDLVEFNGSEGIVFSALSLGAYPIFVGFANGDAKNFVPGVLEVKCKPVYEPMPVVLNVGDKIDCECIYCSKFTDALVLCEADQDSDYLVAPVCGCESFFIHPEDSITIIARATYTKCGDEVFGGE